MASCYTYGNTKGWYGKAVCDPLRLSWLMKFCQKLVLLVSFAAAIHSLEWSILRYDR
jgi:hypothetical protein